MENDHPAAVFFCTPEFGHFQPLRALIARIAAGGIAAYVFTHRDFRPQVERAGGIFVDLFERYPLEEADDQSRPIPCRYVSFAGHFADKVVEEIRRLKPACIISETFSVIGPVVAQALCIPHINVCACHNMNPARMLPDVHADGRAAISNKCYRAVERLRSVFGLGDASAFSYLTCLSSVLNVYCEPPEFLDEQGRAAFEPVAFFGCLSERQRLPAASHRRDSYFGQEATDSLRTYVSFGTVVWRYFAKEAVAALTAISQAFAKAEQLRGVISLGGADVDRNLAKSLENANVRVMSYVDQAAILEEADLFVTHHGLNSTHEAIDNKVAMISYPFFSDQPELARKCQELGLAIPLTQSSRGPVEVADVDRAVSHFLNHRAGYQSNLEKAYRWEQQVMDQRDLVIRQIRELIECGRIITKTSRMLRRGSTTPRPISVAAHR